MLQNTKCATFIISQYLGKTSRGEGKNRGILVKIEVFLLFFTEHIINTIVERINKLTNFLFLIGTQTKEKVKCLFGLLIFHRLYQDTNQSTKKMCFDTFSASKIYSSTILFNKYEWLMTMITFRNRSTLRTNFEICLHEIFYDIIRKQRSKMLSSHRAC